MEPDPPSSTAADAPSGSGRRRSRSYLYGFAPLVLFLLFAIFSRGFYAPMFDSTVPTGGLGLGLTLLGIAGLLMLGGVAVMSRFPTTTGVAVGMICFTFPSLFLVIIGPAICLMAQSMDL